MIATGQEVRCCEMTIETDDRHEAALKFREKFGFWPEFVYDGVAVYSTFVGACEGCGQPLFEDEEISRFADGIVTHPRACPVKSA